MRRDPKPSTILRPLCLLIMMGMTMMTSGCHGTGGASSDGAAASDTKAAKDAAPDKAGADDALPTVDVATARTGIAEKTLPLTGTLAAFRDHQASLSPPVAGTVEALPVHTGQTVVRGQLVLRLSTRSLDGQIAQAQATIRQNEIQVQQAEANALQQQSQTRSGILQAQTAVSGAQATLLGAQATLNGNEAALTNARQSLARTQALFGEGLVAQKDVEAAQLAVRSAESQVGTQRQAVAAQQETVRGQQQAVHATETARLQDTVKQKDIAIARQQLAGARGALTTLENQRALYTVRAPLTGVVSLVGASVGETIDTTTKVLTLTDLSRLQLQIAVPSASADTVRAGMPVAFTVDSLPGRTFRAVIQSVGGQVDPTNGTVLAAAEVTNPGLLLKEGMSLRALVTMARHPNALLVPRAAVLFDAGADSGGTSASASTGSNVVGGPASVLKIGTDGTLHKTSVVTGWSWGDTVEIVSGNLRSGDRIATTGAFGLDDGVKVQISGEADTSGKAAYSQKKEP